MAKVLVSDSNLQAIANAIRSKNGTQNTYTPSTMATAISNIPSGGGSSNWHDISYSDGTVYDYNGNPLFYINSDPDEIFGCTSDAYGYGETTGFAMIFPSGETMLSTDLDVLVNTLYVADVAEEVVITGNEIIISFAVFINFAY